MFKKKCPVCGARNSKERTVCIECGAPLASEQVKKQLSHVSTEAEAPVKTVIEKEPRKRIEEDEYRNNEKVLYKTRGNLSLYGEVDCLVTENHVVIESEEPIEIPLSCIRRCRDAIDYQSIAYLYAGSREHSSNIELTFLNDQNQKHKLSLSFKSVGEQNLFRGAIYRQLIGKFIEEAVEPPGKSALGRFFSGIKERRRDKSSDNMCMGLRSLGIDAQMATRGRIEEEIHGSLHTAVMKALGTIHISEGPIRWVNVCKRILISDSSSPPQVTYYTEYGIPDPKLGPEFPPVYIPATRKKTTPIWGGEDYGLGVINRLNSDHQLKSRDVTIDAIGNYGCWIISTSSDGACVVPSRREWDYYETIASHLMPGRVDKVSREDKRGAVDLPPSKFCMQGRDAKAVSFPGGRRGCVVDGTIEQGTIRDGDEVWIEGHQGTVYEVDAPTGKGLGVAGQKVKLAIVTEWKIGWLSNSCRITQGLSE